MGTGARGLRSCCERLLTETMFEAPGSSIKYVLVTERWARREEAPVYLARGQGGRFQSLVEREEEEWEAANGGGVRKEGKVQEGDGSFEEYRQKSRAAGVM